MKHKKRCNITAVPPLVREALAQHVHRLRGSCGRFRHVARASGKHYHTQFNGWVVQIYRDKKVQRVILVDDVEVAAYVAAAALIDPCVLADAPSWLVRMSSDPDEAHRWIQTVDIGALPPPRPDGVGRPRKSCDHVYELD